MIKSPRLTKHFGNRSCREHAGARRQAQHKCPHRLVDQDAALSRLKPEFESPWGHQITAGKAVYFLSSAPHLEDWEARA